MPCRLWVTNAEQDADGRWQPANLPVATRWVGNLYEKTQGNVRKYVIKTFWTHMVWVQTGVDGNGEAIGDFEEQAHPDAVDLTGLPGVIGPVTTADLAAFLETEGNRTQPWGVGDIDLDWAMDGIA